MMSNRELPVSLPEICAPREELIHTFNRCAKKQCVYVQAPAGYGKTISVLLWLKKAEYVPIWFTLDEYDNILSLFYRSFCRSLINAAPQGETVSQFLSSPSFGASPVENTMEFLSMFTWDDNKYALILDDLHKITNEEILKSLPYIIRRLPSSIRVFFLSRASLPDAMHILEDDDRIAFIGRQELSFTPDEIRRHCASYGRIVTEKEADDIYSYTDGWVIILNAMIINRSLDISNGRYKPSFDDFFEKNIWNSFDEATKTFLVKTSIVDSFTLELCELLTENVKCAEILDMLIRGNINISRSGRDYRFHNLFLEFLRSRLEKSITEAEQKKLYRSAANYYLKTNDFYKAALCAMNCQSQEISMHVMQAFFNSKSPALEQFLEMAYIFGINRVPKEHFNKSPVLYMPNILAAFLLGDINKIKQLFDMFYSALPTFTQINHPVADVAVTRLLLDFRVKLAELPGFLKSLDINITPDKKVPGQAAIITVQMPLLHRSVRDFSEFLISDGLSAETKESLLGLLSCLLNDESEYFYKSVEAGLLTEQNKISEAFGVALGNYNAVIKDENASHEIYFGVSVGLAEIYSIKSDREQYRLIMSRLRQKIEKDNAQYLLKNLAAYEVRPKLWDCDQEAAEEWLENYFVGDTSFSEFYKLYQNFSTVRAYIILSMTDKARSALDRMIKLCEGYNRPLDAAEAGVLMAIAEWISGKRKDARNRLSDLLAVLQPYGYIRVVANEGKAVLPILAGIVKDMELSKEKTDEFKELRRYIKEVYMAAYERSKRFKGLTYKIKLTAVKMSPQQTLVLELLSKGHSNAEIIRITGLSLNTIRSHTKIAYKKLEVTNAFDAVVKAKQLNIIQ